MKKWLPLVFTAVLCAALPAFSVFAQDEKADISFFSFDLGLGLGVHGFFNEEYVPGAAEPETLAYQYVGLQPAFKFGKLDLAVDLNVHFRFNGGDEKDEFEVRKEDWKFDGSREFFDLYLPKIRHIRYGTKGEPFAMNLGDIDGITLGNGFIVSSYTNTLFQPENRVLGAVFNIDGSIVDIPYFGIDFFTGNAARFDLNAGRIYIHPLAGFEKSILKDLEVGGTIAVDRDPCYFVERYAMYDPALLAFSGDGNVVSIYGLDFNLPLVRHRLFTFTLFGDSASQNNRYGLMGGIKGRIGGFLLYEAQASALENNFIPEYFGASYDLFRAEQYRYFDAGNSGLRLSEGADGYLASLGLALFDDKIIIKAVSKGPQSESKGRLYDWQGSITLAEGLVPYFSFDILYDKRSMATISDFQDWKQNSMIRARVNYHSEPALLSLVYILRHIPTAGGPDRQVTAGIEGRVRLY
ncbi:MAG: hypothetical protein LBT68_02025 [Spirochaetales bacterium]|jgi:hypothetical protein|nr:hypothetical protein [Spirochaetales bacterium]